MIGVYLFHCKNGLINVLRVCLNKLWLSVDKSKTVGKMTYIKYFSDGIKHRGCIKLKKRQCYYYLNTCFISLERTP